VKILLDECVDRRLADRITWHDVMTVPQRGWASFKNGELLELAQHEFDALITVDVRLPTQHDLSKFKLRVIVVRARSNRLVDLIPLVPDILSALPRCESGEAIVVSA
jgi:hypothetical protein